MWEDIKNALEYTIIHIRGYELTVFDLITIVLTYLIVRFLLYILQTKLKKVVFVKKNIEAGRQASILQILKYVIYTLFIIFALGKVGIDVSVIMAGSAALLVGLGFGIQHIFNDLMSGLIMLFEGNISFGDIIQVDGLLGKVEKVDLRTTKIHTRDAQTIIVPNHKFVEENIINWTHQTKYLRFEVAVGVAYGSDVRLVEKLLVKCANDHEKVTDVPRPFARFIDFGSSSLDFKLYFWSNEIWRIEDIRSDLRFDIDAAFREKEITIPFPQRDLHIMSSQVPLFKNEE